MMTIKINLKINILSTNKYTLGTVLGENYTK